MFYYCSYSVLVAVYSESVPTFLLMNIRGAQLQVWIYEYQGEDQQVKVEKITYTKGMESNA
jgi:hypothetical protein